MIPIQVDQSVLLTQDIPDLGLHRGDVGIVCSAWANPASTFEVEFHKKNPDHTLRALLMLNQIDLDPNTFTPDQKEYR